MSEQNNIYKRVVFPLSAAGLLLVVDFITKLWVVDNIPMGARFTSWLGGFINIIHVRNLGAAFSFGHDFPEFLRITIMIVIPLLVLAAVLVYFILDKKMTLLVRYGVALVLAGGFGNQFDRVFRPEGVVDFFQVRMYGLFGMEYFPTFNVADSCITVGGAVLILGFLLEGAAKKKAQTSQK